MRAGEVQRWGGGRILRLMLVPPQQKYMPAWALMSRTPPTLGENAAPGIMLLQPGTS